MGDAQQASELVILGLTLDPHLLGLWVQALLTFAILSFLIGDNPVYKFAEHVFVGISAGYGVVIVWQQAMLPLLIFKLFPNLSAQASAEADYLVLIPGILGFLMLSRFIPRYNWLSRYPIAFIVGLYSGASIPATTQYILVKQLGATMGPVAAGGDIGWAMAVSNLVVLIGVICTLAYFYFSAPHEGALGVTSNMGIWFLMIAFGAGFGNTVMARMSLLIGRVEFLLFEWWPIVETAVANYFQ
ncbi:MAG: hypothetical protein R6V19_10240 [Armatimonadota bacterium]